jgi:hypothetical protein
MFVAQYSENPGDEGFTKINKQQNIVLWGPYIQLPQGEYLVFFTLRSPQANQEVTVEVYYGSEVHLLALEKVSLNDQEWQVVPVKLSIGSTWVDKKLEFRVWKHSLESELHLGSLFVLPKAAAASPAGESTVASWVAMQRAALDDPKLEAVLKAFRHLTALSRFDDESRQFSYCLPCEVISSLLVVAEKILQDKNLVLSPERREEVFQHWASLRGQSRSSGEQVKTPFIESALHATSVKLNAAAARHHHYKSIVRNSNGKAGTASSATKKRKRTRTAKSK